MLHGGKARAEPSTDFVNDGMRAFLGVGFERSCMAMLLIDGGQQICCANGAAAVMLSPDNVAGRSVLDFFVPQADPESDLEVARLWAGEVDWIERATVVLADSGRQVQVAMRVDAVTPPSGARLFLMQLRDVSSAVAQETARERSELQYRQLVSNLPGMSVMTFDRDLRFIKAGGEALVRARDDVADCPGNS